MAITSSTSVSQSGLQQLSLQQAKRAAAQAEQTADALQTQAQDARRRANREQENARSLSVQADQAQSGADRAKQGLVALQSANEMKVQLGNTVEHVAQKQQVAQSVSSTQQTAPVVNTQGQVTGTVINTTA
jgi:hypothetical protein